MLHQTFIGRFGTKRSLEQDEHEIGLAGQGAQSVVAQCFDLPDECRTDGGVLVARSCHEVLVADSG